MEKLAISDPAEVYEQYLGRPIADPFTLLLLEGAPPALGATVLDLACGTGSVARHVAPMVGNNGRVVALDVNPAMLAVGRAAAIPAGATIEWRQGDAMKLDMPSGAFDLIYCQQGLQFFSDRIAAAQEMRRVLRPAGRVIISVWQDLSRHPVYAALFEAVGRHLDVPISDLDVSFSLSDPKELRRILRSAGFRDIEIMPRSLDVTLAPPELFVELTVLGAVTSVPAFARLAPATQASLVDKISAEMNPLIQDYTKDEKLTFPMHTNIARAFAGDHADQRGAL